MTGTKRSKTRSRARKRPPRIAPRIVTAPTALTPTALTPTAPEPGSPHTAPTRDHTLSHAPPRRPTRMRISETNPWSVTVMSFLFLGCLGVSVLGALLAASVILDIAAPGEWPTPADTLVIATGAVALEVLLGTALACLCSFMYNYTAQFSGGVEVSLTDDLTDPTPTAQALQLMTRLHARARRRLRTVLPINSVAGKRPYRQPPDDSSPPAVEAGHGPQQP
ncbi:DUF3566 domain-containing protein [Streptomyces sp. NPDC051016]|uniref:DUF3566 domain-containing protein n=1 Tax=Streptomyces sp. NPDC051016 TaxID=3365638 RepID=UPI0037939053